MQITIMIEGGAPERNSDVATVENTESLRYSLHRIFSELVEREVGINIQLKTNYRTATTNFIQSAENNLVLFVDLDDKKENIPNWFCKLKNENPNKPIIISSDKKEKVFFMIQEMEAWILKQPEAIETWAQKNRYINRDYYEKKIIYP